MSIAATDPGALNFLDLPSQQELARVQIGTAAYDKALEAVAQAYGRLALSIATSSGDAGWTGWDWKQDDRNG